jgi:predicted Zn-dependent peptidase
MEGVDLPSVEGAVFDEMERLRTAGATEIEVARARRQLRARTVFETDSVTNIAHQLGYFETVTGPGFYDTLRDRIETVTAEQVADVARRRLARQQCTVGWFTPVEMRR